jgi:broad specificity phosphatase PhoE
MKLFAAFQSISLLSHSRASTFLNTPATTTTSTTQLGSSMVAAAPYCDNATLASEQHTNTNAPPRLSSWLPPLPDNSRRIYLLRHGETEWNVLGKIQGGGHDIPLNDNGRKQALAAACALDDLPIGVVASSQLSRAAETADILRQRHQTAKRTVDKGFGEMSFGEFEGMASRDEELNPALKHRFLTIAKQVKLDVNFPFPGGGECTKQVEARATQALTKLLEEHPESQHVAIVSHGRTNKVLIAATAMEDVKQFPQVKQGSKYMRATKRNPWSWRKK